jgi:hypothetical protein
VLASASVWAEPSRGFQLAATTTHFVFYSRNGEPIDVHEVERSLRKVQRLLGQELPGPAEYYRYGTPQEVAANLGEYATGVTLGSLRQIHTVRRECHFHEIVHLVAAQLGDPGPFFQEGLAVALSGSSWHGRTLSRARLPAGWRRQTISSLAGRFVTLSPEAAYPVAGSFVAFLIKAYGVPRVAAFFRASGTAGEPRDAVFRATFGVGLDEAGAAWAEGRALTRGSPPPPPPCCPGRLSVP